MKLRIIDLQRMLGLSRSAILYYEKKGVLTPQHLENGYREFSQEDMLTLKRIIILRNLGLDVEQIEAQLGSGEHDYSKVLLERRSAIQKEIERKEQLLRLIDESFSISLGKMELMKAEPYLITGNPCCDVEHSFFAEEASAKWLIRNIPVSDICYLLPSEVLDNVNVQHIQPYMEKNYRGIFAGRLGELDVDMRDLRLIPSRLCVHIWLNYGQIESELRKVVEHMRKMGLRCSSEILVRLATMNILLNKEQMRRMELFIPVETM